MPCNESWISCYDPETKRQSSQWKHAGSPRPKKARQSKSTHQLLMIPFFFDSTGMISMHWVSTGQTINKEYYVEVLREFRKNSVGRSQHSSNRISGISTRTMHKSTTPSLSQTIWPRWASRHFLSLPIVQTLLPVTFGYSLSSEKEGGEEFRERGGEEGLRERRGEVLSEREGEKDHVKGRRRRIKRMRQLRRWKRLWRRSLTCSHKRTSMRPSRSCWNGTTSALQPEEITSKGTSVLCVYYQ